MMGFNFEDFNEDINGEEEDEEKSPRLPKAPKSPKISEDKIREMVSKIFDEKKDEMLKIARKGTVENVGSIWMEIYPVLVKMWKGGKFRAKIDKLDMVLHDQTEDAALNTHVTST